MTTDEGRFLQAIFANPADNGPRLIYADWLEERGDLRAELLRLDCQLQQIGPFALSQRLLDLCLTEPPDWVALLRRQPAADAVEHALRELGEMLAGLNYVVSFGIYRIPLLAIPTTREYIRAALGRQASVRSHQDVAGTQLLQEVKRCLNYSGDRSHGPDLPVLRSPAFQSLASKVLSYLDESVLHSRKVESFSLRGWHPFYPVFWDFAYIFQKSHWAVVFLGSSSD